jgi:Transposase DDE domain
MLAIQSLRLPRSFEAWFGIAVAVLRASSLRMWRRTRPSAEARWTSGPRGTPGMEMSPRKRKRVEQSFGWMKMIGMLKKVKLRGIAKVGWLFTFTGAAYNLCRLRNLMART